MSELMHTVAFEIGGAIAASFFLLTMSLGERRRMAVPLIVRSRKIRS